MSRHDSGRSRLGFLALAVALVALVGCSGNPEPNPMLANAGWDSSVRVTVQNQDFNDAAVYANWDGSTRRRIGTVTGKTTETFTMEWQSEVVRFEADFIGGGVVRFEPIDVYGGDHLDLVIMIQG